MRRNRVAVAGLLLLTGAAALIVARPGQAVSGERTVPLDGSPSALALDPRTGHAFVAIAGPNGSNGRVTTLDSATGAVLRTVAVGSGLQIIDPRAMVVDSHTGHVLEANEDTTVSVLDARDGRLLGTLTVGDGLSLPVDMAVDERGGRAFILGNGGVGRITVLDTRDGRPLRVIPLHGFPSLLAVDARARRLFVADSGGTHVLDEGSGRPLRTVSASGLLAVDARAGRVYVAGGVSVDSGGHLKTDATLGMFDSGAGAPVGTTRLGQNRFPLAIGVDDRTGHVFVSSAHAGSGRGMVDILDARSGRLLRAVAVGQTPLSLAVDTRHERVVIADAGARDSQGALSGPGSVDVLDARTGQVLRTIPQDGAPILAAVDERRGRAVVVSRVAVPCARPVTAAPTKNVVDAVRAYVTRFFARAPQSLCASGSVSFFDTTR